MSQPLQVPQLLLMPPQNQYLYCFSQIPNNLTNQLLALQNQREILNNISPVMTPNNLSTSNSTSLSVPTVGLNESQIPKLNTILLQNNLVGNSVSEKENSAIIDTQQQTQSVYRNILQVLPNQLPISLLACTLPQMISQNQVNIPSDSKILQGASIPNINQQLSAQNLSQQIGCSNFTQQLGQIFNSNQSELKFLNNFQNIQNNINGFQIQDLLQANPTNQLLVQELSQQFGFDGKTIILAANQLQKPAKEESESESQTYAEEEFGNNENDSNYESGDVNSNNRNIKQQENEGKIKQNKKQNSINNKIKIQKSHSKEITVKQEIISTRISKHSAKAKESSNSIQQKQKESKCSSLLSSKKQQKINKKRCHNQLQENNSSTVSASSTQNNEYQKVHTKIEDTELFFYQSQMTQSNSLIKYDYLSNQNNSLSISKQPSNYDSTQNCSSSQSKDDKKSGQILKYQKKQFSFSSSESSSQDEEMNRGVKAFNTQGNAFGKLEKEESSEADIASSIENATNSIDNRIHNEDDVANYQSVKKFCKISNINSLNSCNQSCNRKISQIIIVYSLKPKEKVKKSKQDYYNDSNYTKNLLKGFRRYMKKYISSESQFEEFDQLFGSHQLNNEFILKLFAHDEYSTYFNKFLSQPPHWWIQEAKIKDVEKQVNFFNLCKLRKFTSIKTKRKSFKRPLM